MRLSDARCSEIIRRVDQLLRDYAVTEIHHIDLPVLAWGEKLLVEEGPIEGADAWLVDKGPLGIARVRESIAYVGQRRFAIAHELGHWLLHRGITQTHIDQAEQLKDYRSSPMEVEANFFAGEILMPRRMFLNSTCPRTTDLEKLYRLAEEYGVGPTAAVYRHVSLTSQDVMFVPHQDGKTQWYLMSDQCSLRGVLPKTAVPSALSNLRMNEVVCRRIAAAEWGMKDDGRVLLEQTLQVADAPAITLLSPIDAL